VECGSLVAKEESVLKPQTSPQQLPKVNR
jgi:hypothetical protein